MSGKAKAPAKAPAKAEPKKATAKQDKKRAVAKPKAKDAKAKAKAAARKTAYKARKPFYNRPAPFPRVSPFNFSKNLKTRKASARVFINKFLGVKVAGPLEAALKNGTILSKLLNKLKDGSVQFKDGDNLDAKTSNDNLVAFAKAAKAAGIFAFRPRDLLAGDHFSAVLRTVEEIKAQAYKTGKLKGSKGFTPSPAVARGVPVKRVTSAPAPAKGKGKAPARATKTVVDDEVPQYKVGFKSQPIFNRPKPTIARESYLTNLQTDAIPEAFLLKLMSEETLHHGLVVIGFTQGLELVRAGKEYIIPPRGSRSHKTIAFTFLEFLGYKLIPTTKQGGGHLVFADAARKTLAARLLTLFTTANKNAIGLKA